MVVMWSPRPTSIRLSKPDSRVERGACIERPRGARRAAILPVGCDIRQTHAYYSTTTTTLPTHLQPPNFQPHSNRRVFIQSRQLIHEHLVCNSVCCSWRGSIANETIEWFLGFQLLGAYECSILYVWMQLLVVTPYYYFVWVFLGCV